MIAQYRIEPDDALAFRRDAEKTSIRIYIINLLMPWVFTAAFFLYFFFKIRTIPDVYFDELFPTYSKWFFLVFHSCIIFFIVFPLLKQVTNYLAEKIMIKKLEWSSYFGERKLFIDDSGITIEQSNATKTYKWKNIVRVSEDDLRYYVYITDIKAFIIKKNYSSLSEADQEELGHILRRYTVHLSTSKMKAQKKFSISLKTKTILLFLYLLTIGFSKLDWGITLNEASKEVNSLFELTDDPKAFKTIKDSLSQEEINYARQAVYHIYDIGIFDTEKDMERTRLYELIHRAQNQLNEKLGIPTEPKSLVYGGESKTWKITDYKIEATVWEFQAHSVPIIMKEQTKYLANYFKVKAYIDFDEELFENHMLYEFELTPEKPKNFGEDLIVTEGELNIAKHTTPYYSSPKLVNKYGEPATLKDIEKVYFIIEWVGQQDLEKKKEIVILHQIDNT
ncbi:YcxB family protein [Bacillus marasmi]|uniref:YcxB family protein n=1 Tax=Bacillus marasmi TaxID=1926279 RepID=UPI00164CEF89|nr:YcxB family protein [Bacillus marasmi]